MTASARDVAAALRQRLPGVGAKKLHKLLYYGQGHHVATFGQPLFNEGIAAYDMGPVVATLWAEEKYGAPDDTLPPEPLTEAELNTIGYVVSRYGNLTGNDLEVLTHGEPPWQKADQNRRPRESAPILLEWIREYFSTAGSPAAGDDLPLDSDAITEWLANASERYQARYGSTPAGAHDEYQQLVAMRDELAARRGT